MFVGIRKTLQNGEGRGYTHGRQVYNDRFACFNDNIINNKINNLLLGGKSCLLFSCIYAKTHLFTHYLPLSK